MGDKQQNIVVNWKVNTAELEKATAIVDRAQKTTNTLRNSSQQAAKNIAEGYKFASRTIEGMEVELIRLRNILKLTSVTDTTRIAKLKADYKSAQQQLQAFKKEYLEIEKINKQVAQSTQGVTNQFGQLFTAVKIFLTAGVIKETFDMALSMSKLAGNVEGVERAFNRAFPNAQALIVGLRQSTRGTISDFDLMQRSLKASNLGVPIEQFGKLLEFASIRAQQTGDSVDYLVGSIVDGLGRKSLLRLDNLGVSALRLKEALGGVSVQAASVAQVTEAFAKIAGEEIEKMGGFTETAATKVDQLGVSWQTLRETVAKKFEDGGLVSFLDSYVEAFQSLLEADNRGITVAELLADRERKRIALMETQLFLQRNLTGERETDVKFLEETITATQKDLVTRTKLIASQKQILKGLKDELNQKVEIVGENIVYNAETQKDIDFRAKVIAGLEEEFFHREEWLKIYLAQLAALEKGNDVRERELGLIEKLEQDIESINEKIKQATVQGTIFDGEGNLVTATVGSIAALNRQLEIMQGRLADLKKSGLPEFKSPEIFERVSKAIDEDFKNNAENVTQEFINISDIITKIHVQLRDLKVVIPTITPTTFADKLLAEGKKAEDVLKGVGIDILSDQIKANTDIQVESLRVQLDELRNFYDEQMILAGDNERAKDQLRLSEERKSAELQGRIAKREKEARKFSIIVDTAAGIIKAFATMPTPAAIIQSAIIAALGVSQLAIVSRTPVPKFKEGVLNLNGPGTATSDSIPAMLSKGESVMTANETSKSYKVLKEVRAGRLDDRVLAALQNRPIVNVSGMDDSRIVAAIKAQSYPDIIRVGSMVYEAKKTGEVHKKIVKKYSFG